MATSKSSAAKGKAAKPPKPVAQPKRITSTAKAKTAFENFNLSRHAEAARSATFVPPKTDPMAARRAVIAARLSSLANDDAASRQLNVALTPATLKSLMPSYNAARGSVQAEDVLAVLTTYARGSQFLAQGDPTLRRLALQAEVDRIIKAIQDAKS